ncbi:putative Zn-dependent protease and their inactivated-like protein [Rubellimicrobium thermophilum DSM 16684]|uniref:Putative Zn-dependent protease and their inactivated-like protein n=1 Tax=Rubellimicrobium thermophilum DSM 16684 TaxID=1123069 RepID=S9RW87_9RHOB|nr:putative Zn-dependent protease and their inactivated-like protein [Rubellimicrobium thermophilum DSM 16684]
MEPPMSLPSLDALAARLLEEARRAGAEAADAMVVRGQSLSVEVRASRLEEATRAEGVDLGLRVLIGRRQAVVSASDTRGDTLRQMAERAVAMAREAPEDATAGLADPALLAQGRDMTALDLADPAPEPEPAALEQEAREAEAAALAVPGVTQVEAASAGWSRREVALAATNGFAGRYTRTDRSLSVSAISGRGTAMQRDWDWDHRVHAADLRSPAEIGRTAGERAAAREGATRPPTGAFPVLFDERVAASLIGHLLGAINGGGGGAGRVLPARPAGTAGASRRPDPARGSPPPPQPRLAPLGCRRPADPPEGLRGGWHPAQLGARSGLRPPPRDGQHRQCRTHPGGTPAPAVTTVELTQGRASRDDLLAQMGRGLLVTSLIGSTINPHTGDYSRGAAGFWVEGGRISHPVHEATIAGNLIEMFARLVPANDARPHLTRVVPSLLIEEGMTVAGV